MKKLVKYLVVSLGILLVAFITLRTIWSFTDKKKLNVYILDKTVTQYDRHEHKSFTWLLNHYRYVLPNNKSYSNKADYFGFFPVDIENEVFDFKSVRINEVDGFAAAFDVAYYTDCYGVHSFEWYKGKTKPIRSQKVYGGLNQNDFLLLKKMLDQGKLVIGEYNMFSTPTNALIRSKTEAMLGIGWSGWSGKYFSTFDVTSSDGPPEWMKNLFESQHMGVWPVDKSGIILLNNDGLLEILVLDEHLNSSMPIIETSAEQAQRFGVKPQIPYTEWFEFVTPGKNNVPSNIKSDVNAEGQKVFDRLGISPLTPAVIEHSGEQRYYYLCGDFAENSALMWTAKLAGGKGINKFLTQFGNSHKANFYRNFYTPLMGTILSEYYIAMEGESDE